MIIANRSTAENSFAARSNAERTAPFGASFAFSLLLALGAPAVAQVVHAHVPYLRCSSNDDAIATTLTAAPRKTGAIFCEFRTDARPNGFRYFLSAAPITARTTYSRPSYLDPRVRMQLSLTTGRTPLFDPAAPMGPDHWSEEVVFRPGRWYRVLWVWAERDGIAYLGAYVDDRLVAYRRVPGRVGQWATAAAWIGARDRTPVEPSFPMEHFVPEMRYFWFIGW